MANLELLVQVQDRELQQLRKDVRTLSREMGGISTSTRGAATSYSKLSHESTKANREIGRTTRGVIAGSGAFRGLGRAIAFASGAYLGAAGFTAVVRGAYDELQKQATVNAQTNSVLQSTGRIAGVTRGEVTGLSKALEHKTGIDDEAVKTSENLLLTFTNVRHVVGANNDVFARAERAALDLSVRFKKDLPQATVVLGRALQDPIGGLTTLSRIGVRFSDSQKATIKSLVDSGDVLGAQKLILAEVEKRAKGAAAAYGRTLPGQIDKARESFKDLSAEALKPLVPTLAQAAQAAAKFFQRPSTQRELKHDIEEIASAAGDAKDAILLAKDAVGGWKQLLELLIALKVASKISGWAGSIGEFNTQLGPKGGDGALGRTRTLKTELAGLAKIGVITIGIELILNRKSFTDAIKKKTGLDVNQSGLGLLNDLSGGRLKSGLNTITGGRLGGSGTSSKNPYPRGSLLWSLYEAGRVGEPFVPSSGNKRSKEYETQRTAYLQGARARTKGSTEPSAPGAARLKRVQRSVVATARRLGPGSGAVYVTGGTNVKTGYDCSGYLYDIYRKNGITIPRTSEAQWADPNAIQVPKGQEQPGDGVYFTGSSKYPPPGHCGIYVGGDKYIEYFSSGRPARVSRLSEASDYWGARRWIKIKQRAGTAGTTNRPTSGLVTKPKKQTLSALFKTPGGLSVRNAIAAAHGTKGKADDIRALRDEETFLREALKTAKRGTVYRTQILEEIGRVQDKIRAAGGSTATKKTTDLLPRAIRKQIAVAEGTLKNTKDDVAAWKRALAYLLQLQKTVKPTSEKFVEVQQAINDARQQLAGLQKTPSGELVPLRLRTGLSKAEGTKSLQDDLKALRAIQTFLTGALKGARGEKRLTILDELNNVKSQIGGIVRDILDKAQAEITKRRTGLSNAFGKVADSLLSSFDDKTQQLVNGINQQFDQLTPSEQALLGIQNRERGFQRQDLVADVTKAQQRLDRATGKRHDKALRDLQQAQDALGEFDLDPLAQAERDAAEKRRQAALDALDKQRTQERAALEAKIAEFQKMLETGALNMGSAFAKGLLAAFPEFKKAVDKYVKYLTDNGLTGTPGSGLAKQAKAPLPLDPAIATAIRSGRKKTKRSLSDASGPNVNFYGATIIGTDHRQFVEQVTPLLVESTAKYQRRNGRQL